MTAAERSVVFASPADWLHQIGISETAMANALSLPRESKGPLGLLSANNTVGGRALPRHLASDTRTNVYLLQPSIPPTGGSWLWSLGVHETEFLPEPTLGADGRDSRELDAPKAVLSDGNLLFIADTGNRRIQVVHLPSRSLEAVVPLPGEVAPVDLALGINGLWVVSEAGLVLLVDDRDWKLAAGPAELPGLRATRVLADRQGNAYVLMRGAARRSDASLLPLGLDETKRVSFGPRLEHVDALSPPPSVAALEVDHEGNIRRLRAPGRAVSGWYNRLGQAVVLPPDRWVGEPPYVKERTWTSQPIDSEIYACNWHRMRLTLDAPLGTRIAVTAFTHSDRDAALSAAQGDAAQWMSVVDVIGSPETASTHEVDAAFRLEPGRFLIVRIVVTGDGQATPSLSEMRIEFPRRTWLRHLPAVFSEDPDARSFLERFLAMSQVLVADAEEWIREPASLLDFEAAPEQMVEHMAAWLGVRLDREWPEEQRLLANRALVSAAASHIGRRGTPAAMESMLSTYLGMVSGIDAAALGLPALHEGFSDGPPVQLGGAHTGDVICLSGDCECGADSPRCAACRGEAHRFTVYVPDSLVSDARSERILRRAIDDERPAHTTYELVKVHGGVIVGRRARVGLTTLLGDTSVTHLARGASDHGDHDAHHSRLGTDTTVDGSVSEPTVLRPGVHVGEAIR